MEAGTSTKKTLTKVGLALALTFIPIIVFKQVWPILVNYMPLIVGVTSFVAGIFLIFMYFKGYSWQMMVWKIKSLFTQKEDMRQYMATRLDPNAEMYKSKSVLAAGIFLVLASIYTMSGFKVTEVEQSKRGLINIQEVE